MFWGQVLILERELTQRSTRSSNGSFTTHVLSVAQVLCVTGTSELALDWDSLWLPSQLRAMEAFQDGTVQSLPVTCL